MRRAGNGSIARSIAPLILALAALAVDPSDAVGTPAAEAEPPNIVVITTDDQPASTATAQVMPRLNRLITRPGLRFSNSVVSTPLCCPSRSVFLSGQYGHNNGVLWNRPGYADLIDPRNTLPVWMNRAGYRTAHVGKYLNGYRYAVGDPAEPAPGWTDWHTALDPTSYYATPFSRNGRLGRTGTEPRDHTTAIINRTATRIARRAGRGGRPLFMVVDHFAPHRSGGPSRIGRCRTPGPEPLLRERRAFAGAALPRGASFNEPDLSDKPSFMQAREPFATGRLAALERTYGCSLAALRGVDRGIGRIWKALGRAGERRNTAILFTSDNGFYFGEHRLSFEKQVPYRESIEVPLAIRLPASLDRPGSPGRIDELVAGVDLPATILDLAGAEPCRTRGRCRTLDGRSLLPLAAGRSAAWPEDRAIPLQLDVGATEPSPSTSCRYEGLRTASRIYVAHESTAGPDAICVTTREREYYDLRRDPAQLVNAFSTPSGVPAATAAGLAARARSLNGCVGIRARDPRPAGTSPCE